MARLAFKASDDFAIALDRLATDCDSVAEQAIYEGAKIVADEIHKNLKVILSDEATGELERSFGITPIKKDVHGWNVKIGFDGYDKNKVPNQLKARALESGKHDQVKRPFVRPAINKKRKAVIKKMDETIKEEIKKMLG